MECLRVTVRQVCLACLEEEERLVVVVRLGLPDHLVSLARQAHPDSLAHQAQQVCLPDRQAFQVEHQVESHHLTEPDHLEEEEHPVVVVPLVVVEAAHLLEVVHHRAVHHHHYHQSHSFLHLWALVFQHPFCQVVLHCHLLNQMQDARRDQAVGRDVRSIQQTMTKMMTRSVTVLLERDVSVVVLNHQHHQWRVSSM